MPSTRTYNRSFAGGEVSPEMFGRIDDVKFQTGASTIRNFVVLPQGPVQNRAGTKFVREVKDSAKKTRLIPFTFSTTQTMVIEMGHLYIRFHTMGSTLVNPVVTPPAYKAPASVTISSDVAAVVTWVAHGLTVGTRIQFTTGTVLPPPLQLNTSYYIVSVLTANTFWIGFTPGGVPIPTGGPATLSGSVTISNADVALVTKTAHGLATNQQVIFPSVQGLPPKLLADTPYFVSAPNTANSFALSATAGGPVLDTSQVQSCAFQSNSSPGAVALAPGHGLSLNQAVLFNDVTQGTLPSNIIEGTTYYISGLSGTNVINVSTIPGGTSLNFTGVPLGFLCTMTYSTPTSVNMQWVAAPASTSHTGHLMYYPSNLVQFSGNTYYAISENAAVTPTDTAVWYQVGPVGDPYTIPSPYTEADLFDIHYVQSADVLTLVHTSHAPRELRRLSATEWSLIPISFLPSVTAPQAPSVIASRGEAFTITSVDTALNPDYFVTGSGHGFIAGDPVYVSGVTGVTNVPNGFYVIDLVSGTPANKFTLRSYTTGLPITIAGTYTNSSGTIEYGAKISDIDNYYVVTAIGANGVDESPASPAGSVVNNLYANGSFNTLSWGAVAGAVRYKIYKRQSGMFGYIGATSALSFVDDNIAPDMGLTTVVIDSEFASANNYPGAVSYFEQRRVFAGTINSPQQIWFTRSGTESDLSYRIPVQDDDRISFRVASREANTIRHIVPLSQLVLLTSAAEWRVSPVNSDAITPTTISVRPQAYIGASQVQPVVINNSMVYCAARGGHVRELGYSWESNGYVTGDLSLRAAHLFDTFAVNDIAYSKAPQPMVWFVSSTGKLLGLTYVPEQQIGAWHQHDTDGAYESCAVVAEGDEDVLYVVVKRTINSVTKRYVEQFQTREISSLENCFFVDAGLTYDGNNTTATTVTVTGGTTWGPPESLTITATTAIFTVGTSDIGDGIVFTDAAGVKYTLTINSVTSTTVATATPDKVLPVAFRAVATAAYGFARNSVSGLSHLEGKTVSILADGSTQPQEVVAGGIVNLDHAAVKIHVGLPYISDLQTLPLGLNIDAFGQGRAKNINQAWLRVFQSSAISVGPSANKLTEAKLRTTEPYASPPALRTDEVKVVITPTWSQSGQVFVRQSQPLPLTVVGMTLEAVLGA